MPDDARRQKMGGIKMLEGWLAILSVIGIVSFGVYYNSWLMRTHGCSALTFWRVIGGIMDLFLWLAVQGADSTMHGVILFLIAAIIFLLLFFANYQDSKSVLHGLLMTLWLILFGGAIMWLLSILTDGE